MIPSPNGLSELLARGSYEDLKSLPDRAAPEEIARLWSGLPAFRKIVLFRLLDRPAARSLFRALPRDEQWLLMQTLHPGALGPVAEKLEPGESERLFWTPDESTFDELERLYHEPQGELNKVPDPRPGQRSPGANLHGDRARTQ